MSASLDMAHQIIENLLLFTSIKNVHDIPDALDLDKFKLALSKSLAVYRHACGRLVKERSGADVFWKVRGSFELESWVD